MIEKLTKSQTNLAIKHDKETCSVHVSLTFWMTRKSFNYTREAERKSYINVYQTTWVPLFVERPTYEDTDTHTCRYACNHTRARRRTHTYVGRLARTAHRVAYLFIEVCLLSDHCKQTVEDEGDTGHTFPLITGFTEGERERHGGRDKESENHDPASGGFFRLTVCFPVETVRHIL